jgi:LacI family transcriptional regulator
VLLNRRSTDESFSSVSVDDVAGGRMAVEHLISLGRRRIAFAGAEDTIQFTDRLAGAREAIAANPGVSFEVLAVSVPHVLDGRAIGTEIAARRAEDRPDGVFASNDVVAMGILQAFDLADRPVIVPDDVALIGYDDIDFAATAVVPLSSIRHPAELIGATAVGILLEEAARPELPRRQVVFQPEMVVRASTRGLRD